LTKRPENIISPIPIKVKVSGILSPKRVPKKIEKGIRT
jgi:hypothetical protein